MYSLRNKEMPIKNYTTQISAAQSIQEIQTALVEHGAVGIFYEYEKGTGRITALKFGLEIEENRIGFSLPVNWKKFQAVLKQQEVKRCDDEDYCYRVAWRDIRDWIMAQLALYETEIVEMPQIFLPFMATNKKGETIYDQIKDNQFLLGEGKNK